MTFPKAIRAWRERMELTQAAAAEMLGMSLRTYQEWEQGSRPPAHEKIIRLALMALESNPKAKGV